MIFDMKKEQHFASFYDEGNKIFVVIDSFDNEEFNLRIGTLSETEFKCSFLAQNNEELNKEIEKEFLKYKENKDF